MNGITTIDDMNSFRIYNMNRATLKWIGSRWHESVYDDMNRSETIWIDLWWHESVHDDMNWFITKIWIDSRWYESVHDDMSYFTTMIWIAWRRYENHVFDFCPSYDSIQNRYKFTCKTNKQTKKKKQNFSQ